MRSTERFEAAYREHYWAVARYVARRLGTEDDTVRDLTAEVFVVAWRRRRAMPPGPLPWLYVVARNVVSNELRRRGRVERLEQRVALEQGRADPHAPAAGMAVHDGGVHGALVDQPAADESGWVRRALGRLSPADQEVLRLAAWEELSTDHLAEALAVSRSAAAMRLHRARERLRQVLHADPVLSDALRRSR